MLQKLFFKFSFFLFFTFLFSFSACSNQVQIRKSALYYFEEGNSSLKQRDYQMAVWNYQKAINLDSESPNFHYNLGLVPNQTDTYYNLALAHYKMSNSRMADIYYNRYQDMLSLRKAKERLEEVRKEQEREARISESNSNTKVLKSSSSITKKESLRKNNNKKGKLKTPNWEK